MLLIFILFYFLNQRQFLRSCIKLVIEPAFKYVAVMLFEKRIKTFQISIGEKTSIKLLSFFFLNLALNVDVLKTDSNIWAFDYGG